MEYIHLGRMLQQLRHCWQDPTVGGGKGTPEGAPFLSWLLTELSLEPGLADTLADIIKDQLYVNPLEYLEADNDLEVGIVSQWPEIEVQS